MLQTANVPFYAMHRFFGCFPIKMSSRVILFSFVIRLDEAQLENTKLVLNVTQTKVGKYFWKGL